MIRITAARTISPRAIGKARHGCSSNSTCGCGTCGCGRWWVAMRHHLLHGEGYAEGAGAARALHVAEAGRLARAGLPGPHDRVAYLRGAVAVLEGGAVRRDIGVVG